LIINSTIIGDVEDPEDIAIILPSQRLIEGEI
jgi:hypothetical protein